MEPMVIKTRNHYGVTVRTTADWVTLIVRGPGGGERARLRLNEDQVHELMVWLGAAQAELDLKVLNEAEAA